MAQISTAKAAPKVDPATVEIVRHALVAAAEEMMTNVRRAAYSPSIFEIQDVCVGLYDADANMLSVAPGLPMLLADLGEAVRDGFEIVGKENMKPGDVYASNDPFTIGTHNNNIATYLPVYLEGDLVGFSVVRAHQVDLGGAVPGSRSSKLTEIYQEGLRLRQIKLYDQGKPVEDIHRIIAYNSRVPDAVMGDLRAQVAACQTGERRYLSILRKYGRDVVEECVRQIFEQGERAARQAVEAIPDGRYSAEAFIDNDGIEMDKHVPVRVTVEVKGSEMTFDFSNYADQVKGSINTGPSGSTAIARNAFKCIATPGEPANEGHFRPMKVVIPPGKVISAKPPAGCGWWYRTTSITLDVIYTALSQAIPDRMPAAHFGDLPMCLLNGYDNNGRRFVFFEPAPGGHGGRPFEDGVSATVAFHEGDTPDVPAEVQESLYPIHIEECALDQDSAGAGKFRGGLGYKRVFRLLSESAAMQLAVDRHYCAPWGLYGGKAARPNGAFVQDNKDAEWKLMLKEDGVRLSSEARVMVRGGGGGGWGDPLDRDPARVQTDLVAGYISREAAERDYCVVVGANSQVDLEATKRLREQHRKAAGAA